MEGQVEKSNPKKKEKTMETKSEPKHLDFLVKTQLAIEKIRIAAQVRNSHLHLRGENDPICGELQKRVQAVEDFVDKTVADTIKDHPAYDWFSQVKGVGKENIAKVIGLVDITRAPHISSLWKFAGMHTQNGKAPKPEKGKKLDYNSTLRTMCWRLGSSLIRAKGKFYQYYLKEKNKYQTRFKNQGYKIMPSDKLPTDKKGRKYEPKDVLSEGHLDNMARRKMIKLFLSMLYVAWRSQLGLPISSPFSIVHLGHNHLYKPKDFIENA